MSKPLFAAELSDLIAELYAPTPASPAEWAAIERDLAYLGRRSEPGRRWSYGRSCGGAVTVGRL